MQNFKPKVCTVCDSQFTPTSASHKVCKSCGPAYRQRYNVKHLTELRRKNGETPLGTILQCPDCGVDFALRPGPQKRCPECTRKLRLAKFQKWAKANPEKIARYAVTANNNYHFSGNRLEALERDNHTCQECGSTDDLHVHHIDGLGSSTKKARKNNALSNLQTLCRGCHAVVHHEERRHSS